MATFVICISCLEDDSYDKLEAFLERNSEKFKNLRFLRCHLGGFVSEDFCFEFRDFLKSLVDKDIAIFDI
jgi:hypothetical protein